MSTSNDTRAERARNTLQAYIEAKGEAFKNSSSEVADLMADLLHLVAGIDQGEEPVESALRIARMHFDAEHANPEEESNRLHIIDQALRAAQHGFDPYTMACAVFDALGVFADAEQRATVRRIIHRNLMDTDFNRMAEEVAAAVEGVA